MSASTCDLSHIQCREDQIVVAKFFSSTDTNRTAATAHIPDVTDGYVTELQRLAQATPDIGSAQLQYDATTGLPYSTRLRALFDVAPLIGRRRVRLVSMLFQAIDTTTAGGTGQDATTNTTVMDSITPGSASYSANDGYMQSRFRGSVVGGWQPNWFRPRLLVDRKSVFFRTMEVTSIGSRRGDLSIGLSLPWCWRGDCSIGPITSGIEVYAAAWQRVDNGSGNVKYLRYAIDCEMIFVVDDMDEPGC
ncbi:MAG: hypothetical protein ABI876_01925 [Bacteroidota bacterium]